MNYLSTRVIESFYGACYLVQGQSEKSYNWVTLVSYPISQKHIAEIDACNKAKKISLHVNRQVTAYNNGGYAIKSFIKGNPV